ncbi:WD40-repeat-containing domain protein, partial [Phycomyces blakesleeanus]
YTINAIKVAQLLDKEVLVTVAENGHVGVWITEDLDKEPLVLRHEDVSTWGLAIHKDGLVAVSTNNKIVTVFNILELTKTSRMFENDPDSKRKRRKRNALKDKKVVNLVGHEHNIPNIDFSHSGRYIASCSIDRTCRVWDLTKEKVVTQRKTALSSQESDSW